MVNLKTTDMNTNAPLLVTISKICSMVSLIGFILLLISSVFLEDAGLVFFFIVSAFAALISLVASISLLAMGNERTGLLIVMLAGNVFLLLIYGCVLVYFGFFVPIGVSETLNGG